MDEKKRIEDIKSGLKKGVYAEAARIKVEQSDDSESTERLSNILDGYVDKIDTIEADNMEELEEELRVLKQTNVEVGSMGERDLLVQQYNDYIHNDLDRTIAETVEYTYNLNNHTDDLNDILIRPMAGEKMDDFVVQEPVAEQPTPVPEIAPDTGELFEIEATTDLGVFEDIVELESDTLDIEGTIVGSDVTIGEVEAEQPAEKSKKEKTEKPKKSKKTEKPKKEKTEKPKKVKKEKKANKPVEAEKAVEAEKPKKSDLEDFEDEKGLAAFDYALIVVLIIIFAILIGLVAKINGVF